MTRIAETCGVMLSNWRLREKNQDDMLQQWHRYALWFWEKVQTLSEKSSRSSVKFGL